MNDSVAEFPAESDTSGAFVRQASRFREWVRADGSTSHPAAAGRYHLYASLACPWAHRAIILRKLKGLESAIGMTVVDPIRDEKGWRFRPGRAQDLDTLNGWEYLSEGYVATDPSFSGRVTVPVLWDTVTKTIVSNESADVIVMLNSEFDEWAEHPNLDFYPEALRPEIDAINEQVYTTVNNGVYKAGFATSQLAYEAAFDALFATLDELDERLGRQRHLVGDHITLADWRLFTTLLRFDSVYHGHFKCNLRRIVDYPNLWDYTRELYQVPGVAATVDFDHIKRHYYVTHHQINPTGIVPKGPALDWDAPHGRG